MHLTPTPEMTALARLAFGYNGKTYKVETAYKYHPQTYWDEGSKRDCVLVRREGLEVARPSTDSTNPFTSIAHETIEIPVDHFIIEHRIFRGTSRGVTFIIRPDECDTAMLQPPNEELSQHEQIVLLATLTFKSSYGGIKDYRLHEARSYTGITATEYEAAKRSLINRGFLNKVGAATIKGKNERDRLPHSLTALKSAV